MTTTLACRACGELRRHTMDRHEALVCGGCGERTELGRCITCGGRLDEEGMCEPCYVEAMPDTERAQ